MKLLKKKQDKAVDETTEKEELEEEYSQSAIEKAKEAVIKALDQNGNGQLEIEDLIILALKTPGVRINRAEFLRKELFINHTEEEINKAIETRPAEAGIDSKEINKIADEVIKAERLRVSGISAALGAPGGWAMAATLPADIIQYYGCLLRVAQKLMYLYGFPELETGEDGLMLDSQTIHQLTICLGVMFGVYLANGAIRVMAEHLASGVNKELLKAALTKRSFYQLVKEIAKWFDKNLTKTVFAGFFKKAIPVAGIVVGGGITFLTFKPCCNRLKKALKDTKLSNPDHISTEEENAFVESIIEGTVIDVDIDSIVSEGDEEQTDKAEE